ncbi:MAG: molybdopterin-synthase adenylyltransferase MoeB [Rubricoccaceae bacterium]
MAAAKSPAAAPVDWTRYARQTILPEVGRGGQARLARSRVLLVGAGGLGAPAALYLAAAGVGHLRLVDDDRVERSNLHRQVLYTDADAGRLKVEVAAERLGALNPDVHLEPHAARFEPGNAFDLLEGCDLVLDGTDVFATRYLVNDASVLAGVPNVFASVSRFEGQASVFGLVGAEGRRGPCYRCVFPEPPPEGLVPSCAEGGVLGVLPGLLGLVQATEALKLLLGAGTPLAGRLLLFDTLGMRSRTLRLERDPACAVCGDAPTITTLTPTAVSCSAPVAPSPIPEISPRDLEARLKSPDAPFVLDVRRPDEYAIANIGGALIPLDELPDRLGELEEHRGDPMFVVMCRSGARSGKAVELLHAHGFTNAVNLRGGILAWSDDVDPAVPRY